MQTAAAAAYDEVHVRVGDLAWRARYHTHRELALELRLWEVDGRLAGWTWFRTNGGFEVVRLPPYHHDDALLEEMLEEIDDTVSAALAAGDGVERVYTFFLEEDEALAEALEARGYERSSGPGGEVLTRDLGALPDRAELPAGYHRRWLATDDHLLGRVEAQQAAFAPSDLTLSIYRRVQRTWPYRAELDRIVMSEDGRVVAFATAWLDEDSRAGLLEPVGTHPDHRRRGLAAAVCLDALVALRDAGARVAQIGTSGEAALATYSAIGFHPWKREVTHRRTYRSSRAT